MEYKNFDFKYTRFFHEVYFLENNDYMVVKHIQQTVLFYILNGVA